MVYKWFRRFEYLVEWTKDKLSPKQFLLFSSVLVGLSVGISAIILKYFAHSIYLLSTYKGFESFKVIFLFFPLIGILLTVLIVKRFFKDKLDRGLALIHYSLAKKSSTLSREHMFAHIITSSVTVGMGGSAGLEAPIVVTGAAFGSNYSRKYRMSYQERTLLLACGISAGIASVFNAPIAGVLFALEVLLIDISISAFTPLILAAATGALVSMIFIEESVLLRIENHLPFNYHNTLFYVLLGVLAGLISVYHARAFMGIEHFIKHKFSGKYSKVLFSGIGLAVLIAFFPSLFGEGYQSIKYLSLEQPDKVMAGSFLTSYFSNEWLLLIGIGFVIFLKAVATSLTIGGGGNGGNFAPSLFVGSYLGYFVSRLINMLNISSLPVSNFTLVGMAGILSGLYHAPLTAIFLIAEITGGYSLMIPLMIVSSISFAISKYFEPLPMDTKKLGKRGVALTYDRDHNILTSIQTSQLIETNFQCIDPEQKLESIIEVFSKSQRNIFPVVDKKMHLKGVIILDNIRDIMFKSELYDKLQAKELMTLPKAVVSSNESMEDIMTKFDETGAWNLPVIDNGCYIGFISKSSVFASYRSKLKETTIH